MIECQKLQKSFVSYTKQAGFRGTLQSFFARKSSLKHAVEEFDLSVGKGEIVGLLGPNGAGKTTLMKMLSGIIHPTSGLCRVDTHVPAERSYAFRKSIALVMGQKSQLWWDIPAAESFRLLQRYYEIPHHLFAERLDELITLLSVGDLLGVQVRKLSLGERMKMELIACLLHDPRILFLDEPTIGLDLVSQNNIRGFLLDYHKRRQITILLTSHYMADVTALCSRIVLIFSGRKKYDGPLHRFERILGSEKVIHLYLAEAKGVDAISADMQPSWSDDGRKVTLRIPEEQLSERLRDLLASLPIVDIQSEKLPVEFVMEALMRRPEILD